jgi:hypothetical protein
MRTYPSICLSIRPFMFFVSRTDVDEIWYDKCTYNYLKSFILVSVVPSLFDALIKLYPISQKWLVLVQDRVEFRNSGSSRCKSWLLMLQNKVEFRNFGSSGSMSCLLCHKYLVMSVLHIF